MRHSLALLAIAAALLAAPQDPAAPAPKLDVPAPAPLPPGQTKVLQAVVLEVTGAAAQWRAKPAQKWQAAKVNDLLDVGAEIRTGRESTVTLRVGMNATMLVDRQTRIAIPEVVQDGKVLRTRLAMNFGQTDLKVDRIGLENDVEVATPTATLAVKGTGMRISWDAVNGFQAKGVSTNRIRAIEVRYLNGIVVYLSADEATRDPTPLPALRAFRRTFYLPIAGTLSPDEVGSAVDNPALLVNFFKDLGIEVEPPQSRTGQGQKASGGR